VLVWVTYAIEQDFETRRAFPKLRHASARAHRGAAVLHGLTAAEAGSVLEDAIVRVRSVRQQTRNAYRAHIKSVRAAIQEAAERPAVFASPAAVSVRESCWRGTKEQLKAHGIHLDGPWPHEPGGKRWAQAKDSRGYKTNITHFSAIWPGLYLAKIEIPYEVRKRRDNISQNAELAKRSLESMFDTADDFRAHLIDIMRIGVQTALAEAIKPANWHGYTLDLDGIDEIHESFDAVVDAVAAARVHFDPALHAKIAQAYRAQIAGADDAFQAQFETLVRPNPQILEGGAP